jgi:DNA-directed RNA polymerase specialized sigma24 family protein
LETPDPKDHGPNPENDFAGFYEYHHALVYGAAYQVTHRVEDAQDITQSVFTSLLTGKDQRPANITGYLIALRSNSDFSFYETASANALQDASRTSKRSRADR